MTARPTPPVAIAAACLLAAAPACAQSSAEEVLRTAMERYEARMEGVENYTIVQSLGGETPVYFERVETEDGRPRFRVVSPAELRQRAREEGEDPAGARQGGGLPSGGLQGMLMREASQAAMDELMEGGGASEVADPYAMFEQMAPRAELRGTERVDGREAYVVAIDDMRGIDLGGVGEAGEGAAGFRPTSATFWLDGERYVALRSVLKGTLRMEGGQESEVTFNGRMSDYREVEGMLHPFRTEMSIEGLGAALSDEQRAQLERAREQMEQMRERLEDMPEEQRAMVESMMEERMPDMDALGAGSMEVTVEVEELRVNEGPPELPGAAGPRQARQGARGSGARDEARGSGDGERDRARRAPEEGPEGVPADYSPRFPQYHGVYESAETSDRFFVTETCQGSLAMGMMRGDVAPWVFERASDEEFSAPSISPGGDPVRIRLGSGQDGAPSFAMLGERWERFGEMEWSEPLPEAWGICMQQHFG